MLHQRPAEVAFFTDKLGMLLVSDMHITHRARDVASTRCDMLLLCYRKTAPFELTSYRNVHVAEIGEFLLVLVYLRHF